MLHIILLILKIIGITLLCIIGLILLLTLVVLFVPVRYKAALKYNDDLNLKAKVTWLLHLLSVTVTYPDEKLHFTVKIFGIRIIDNNRPPRQKKEKKQKEQPKITETLSNENPINENTGSSNIQENETEKATQMPDSSNENPSPTDSIDEEGTPNTKKKSIIQKIKDLIQKIRYTIHNICDKIKKIIHNIEYYIDLWHKKQTQAAYKHIKQEIKRLFLHIRPRKLKGYVEFGMENPETTGKILGGVSMFYALYGNNILIVPNFNEKVMNVDLKLNGRIRFVVLLGIGLRLIRDKNLRRLLKLLKQEDN